MYTPQKSRFFAFCLSLVFLLAVPPTALAAGNRFPFWLFGQAPAKTATPSPSATPTPSEPSITPTPTASPTATPTPVASTTPTGTASATPVATPVITVTPVESTASAAKITPSDQPTPEPTKHRSVITSLIKPPQGLLSRPGVTMFYQANHLTRQGTILLGGLGGGSALVGGLLLSWPRLAVWLRLRRLQVSPGSWYYRLTSFL